MYGPANVGSLMREEGPSHQTPSLHLAAPSLPTPPIHCQPVNSAKQIRAQNNSARTTVSITMHP